MIKHIVFLEFHDHVTEEQIAKALTILGDLKYSSIPEIKYFSFGKNNSHEGLNKNFQYGFIMEFDSEKDRDLYISHTDHIEIAQKFILPLVKNGENSICVLDFKA